MIRFYRRFCRIRTARDWRKKEIELQKRAATMVQKARKRQLIRRHAGYTPAPGGPNVDSEGRQAFPNRALPNPSVPCESRPVVIYSEMIYSEIQHRAACRDVT